MTDRMQPLLSAALTAPQRQSASSPSSNGTAGSSEVAHTSMNAATAKRDVQIIHASVVATRVDQQSRQQLLQLKSGNDTFEVSSQRPIAKGSQLTLAIDSSAKPVPTVEVLSVKPPPSGTSPATPSQSGAAPLQQAVQQLLRSRLPIQTAEPAPSSISPNNATKAFAGNAQAGGMHSQIQSYASQAGPVAANKTVSQATAQLLQQLLGSLESSNNQQALRSFVEQLPQLGGSGTTQSQPTAKQTADGAFTPNSSNSTPPTANQVKHAILQSGIFHEADLMQQLNAQPDSSAESTSQDLAGQLFRAAGRLFAKASVVSTTLSESKASSQTGTAQTNPQATESLSPSLQKTLQKPLQPPLHKPLHKSASDATQLQKQLNGIGAQYSQRQSANVQAALDNATPPNLKTLLTRLLAEHGGLAQQGAGSPSPLSASLPTSLPATLSTKLPTSWASVTSQSQTQAQAPTPTQTGTAISGSATGLSGSAEAALVQQLRGALANIETQQIQMRQAQSQGESLLRSLLLFNQNDQLQQATLDLRKEQTEPLRELAGDRASERTSEKSPEQEPLPSRLSGNSSDHNNASDNGHAQTETKDQRGEAHRPSRWHLNLHFDLQQTGPLDVQVVMGWPDISVTFWSPQAQIRQQLSQQMAGLRSTLGQLGARVELLDVKHGLLPDNEQNRIEQRLVDLHT
ncbi:flagellar hook-length control protein FliK [Oceanobacter kriegii]|uniref:flagellar hook-length control protein FliK n=1 Tax=Oceanobacter kriegii TaxID=64972 RepID=UPI00040EF9A7|nr:flagellar hook-length control protein FliK [Oceanobacter kriegii]